jgi:ribosomal protein L40E
MPAAPPGPGASVTCLECGADNDGDRRFCRRCGSSLDLVALAGPLAAPPAPGPVPAPGALEGPVLPGGPPARSPAAAVPDAPRIAARAPVVPPGKGLQPAEAAPRAPAIRPASAPAEVAPGGPLCPQCGTANPPGRRFCRRCGAAFTGDDVALPATGGGPPERRRGRWPRVTARRRADGDDGGDQGLTPSRAARSAYRHTLDVRYRVLRVLAVVAGVGLLAGSLGFAGVNPISGARGLWDRFFPRDARVGELEAVADPPEVVDVDFAPGAAVDGDPKTAWAATWQLEPGADPADGCGADESGTGGATGALEVALPAAVELSKLSIQPGLPPGDPGRAAQWQPTRLELRFDDGSCTQVDLKDQAGFQDHRLDGPETRHVRIAVLDAAPPRDPAASTDQVAIGELRLYSKK